MLDDMARCGFLLKSSSTHRKELQTILLSHFGCTASSALRTKNLSQIIDIYLIETTGRPPSPWEETIWKNSASRENVCLLSVPMCLEIIHRARGTPV